MSGDRSLDPDRQVSEQSCMRAAELLDAELDCLDSSWTTLRNGGHLSVRKVQCARARPSAPQ